MKIFFGREALPQQLRAAHHAIAIHNEAAIRLVPEDGLRDAEHASRERHAPG